MEGHAKKLVERYCELARKSVAQLHNVAAPCIDKLSSGNFETVGDESR